MSPRERMNDFICAMSRDRVRTFLFRKGGIASAAAEEEEEEE